MVLFETRLSLIELLSPSAYSSKPIRPLLLCLLLRNMCSLWILCVLPFQSIWAIGQSRVNCSGQDWDRWIDCSHWTFVFLFLFYSLKLEIMIWSVYTVPSFCLVFSFICILLLLCSSVDVSVFALALSLLNKKTTFVSISVHVDPLKEFEQNFHEGNHLSSSSFHCLLSLAPAYIYPCVYSSVTLLFSLGPTLLNDSLLSTDSTLLISSVFFILPIRTHRPPSHTHIYVSRLLSNERVLFFLSAGPPSEKSRTVDHHVAYFSFYTLVDVHNDSLDTLHCLLLRRWWASDRRTCCLTASESRQT